MPLGSTLSFAAARAKCEEPRLVADPRLGPRHLKIARLMADGLRHKDIAKALGITVSSSKVYACQLYALAGLSGPAGVANWVNGRSAEDVARILKAWGVTA